jgi:hypothetical protein
MWGNRCCEFGRQLDHIINISSIAHPYLSFPILAAQTAITVGLWASVGTLMTSRLAEIVPSA